MKQLFFVLSFLLSSSLIHASIVPFFADPDFSVVTLSGNVGVVCSCGVSITCQAVLISSTSQQMLGVAKTIDTFKAYMSLDLIALSSTQALVCYSTYGNGSVCDTLEVDPNFGLLAVNQVLQFCSNSENCESVSLLNVDPNTACLCFTTETDGYCSKIDLANFQSSPQRLYQSPNEVWLKTSLFKSPTGPIVFCKVIQQQGSLEYDYYSETLSTGECITLDPQTFTPNSINSMNVGVASNVAGAYLGQVNNEDRFLICYLTIQDQKLYCSGVFLLEQSFFTTSTNAFVAPYVELPGLKVHTVATKISSLLASLVCISTLVTRSSELTCTMVTLDSAGTVTIDPYEISVDQTGFYLQNVAEVLQTEQESGGAYLTKSVIESTQPSNDEPYLSQVTIVTNFANTFIQASSASISSVGCIAIKFDDIDSTRFCVGTPQFISIPAGPSVFPPFSYCNKLKKKWECESRPDFCILNGKKCESKYDCNSAKTENACLSLIKAGGLCQYDQKQCLPTYDWNPKTMCTAITNVKECLPSSGCVWVMKTCQAAPFCNIPNEKLCSKTQGCVWLRNQCGSLQ